MRPLGRSSLKPSTCSFCCATFRRQLLCCTCTLDCCLSLVFLDFLAAAFFGFFSGFTCLDAFTAAAGLAAASLLTATGSGTAFTGCASLTAGGVATGALCGLLLTIGAAACACHGRLQASMITVSTEASFFFIFISPAQMQNYKLIVVIYVPAFQLAQLSNTVINIAQQTLLVMRQCCCQLNVV